MALVFATKNGNWSDTTVWNTGSLPTNADVVRPNNFTVTIDINVDVLEMRNDAGGGAVLGGSFTLNDGVTVTTSNGFFGTYGSLGIGLLNYGGAGSVIINGNVEGSKSSVSNTCAISNNSTGTITINGNISSSGSGSTSQTLRNQSTGTFIVNGDLVSFSGILVSNAAGTTTIIGNIISNTATAIANTSGTVTITGDLTVNEGILITNTSGTITITGDLTQTGVGTPRNGITNTGNGTVTIVGNLQGTSNTLNGNARLINNSSSGIINVTGNVNAGTGAASNSISIVILNSSNGVVNITGSVNSTSAMVGGTVLAVQNTGSGIINLNGNCIGNVGPSLSSVAISNTSIGVVNITGNAIGGSTGLAISNILTGTINLNGNAVGGTSYAALEGANSAGSIIVEKIVFGANGQTATRGYIKFKNTVNIAAETVLLTDATTTNLVDINVVPNLQPSISDVRLGVTYSSGSLTGTMNVPPFNAVKAGVPVDNGVGTAALTPQDVWNVLISGITQSGSIGERLKIVSTIETTGTQLASFNV
jgi:filamentous hemagglutinin